MRHWYLFYSQNPMQGTDGKSEVVVPALQALQIGRRQHECLLLTETHHEHQPSMLCVPLSSASPGTDSEREDLVSGLPGLGTQGAAVNL